MFSEFTGQSRFFSGGALIFLAFPLMFASTTDLRAWGPNGHRITGRIAENHLSPRAKRSVRAILDGKSLAEVSTWADEIRSNNAWKCAGALHYASIPDDGSYLESPFSRRGDVVRALIFFEDVLRDPAESTLRRAWALKFLVHFIGDLHQPLHIGRKGDRGGNRIRVRWFRKKTNLHRVWDSEIIEFQRLSYTEFAGFLDRVDSHEILALQATTYLDWAHESLSHRARVYRCYIKDGCRCSRKGGCKKGFERLSKVRRMPRLGYRYNQSALAIAKTRLLAGGVRLAGILNSVFQRQALTPAALRMRKLIKKKDPLWDRPIRSCFSEAGNKYFSF